MDHPIASTSSGWSADQEELGAVVGPTETPDAGRPADLFVLFSSGYMKTCPYETNHIVRETRFSKHVMKCRHDFVISQAEEGREVLMLPCRYNPDHQALAQELVYHEEFCPDKEQVGLLQNLLEGSTDDEEDVVIGGYDTQLENAQDAVSPTQSEDSTQPRRRGRRVRLADLEGPRNVPEENFTEDEDEEEVDDDWFPLLQNEVDTSWFDWYRDPREDYYHENEYDDYFYQ